MQRLWRSSAGRALSAVAALEVGRLAYISTAGAELNDADTRSQIAGWTVLSLFLVWRTWRRGAVSHGLLVVLSTAPILLALWSMTEVTWYVAGLLASGIAQVVLLLSPVVRSHLRQSSRPTPTDVSPQASATSSA